MKYIKQHKIVFALILLIPIIIFTGQYYLNKSSVEISSSQQIQTEVKKGNISSTVSASGQIETANYLAITTSVNGIVKKVYVKEGDIVKKGQKIIEVTLDSEGEISLANAYASYLRAKNALDSAKNSLIPLESAVIQKEEAFDTEKEENSYQSHDERISYKLAENDYFTAKNNYESKKNELTQLQISANSAWNEYQSQSPVITASYDGYIANIVAVEGTRIENSVSERSVQTVASIKIEGTPIAVLNITELDINNIKVGQKAKILLNSVRDETFTGTVVGIDKIGSLTGGVSNYPVIIKFDQNTDKALPNMGVEADIILESKEGILYVPTAAVKSTKNGKAVTVVANGQQINTAVKTGISDSSNTEILEGLNEGDVVLMETLPTSGFSTNSQVQFRGVGGVVPFGGR
ncbi:MAG: Efflux transporter, RND family, MFP subunit [candidate division WWE3 bacterium GW2011_GWF2_41_45]|nr:MAG: Efflux transporter, RND family, MFP subunit [candidate division WWE3 bacterium GW2011_GWC2_41_23]KKS10656.1 MAG: Efflux transporter, RND family, MFP subunit [candidate division WWE3 bacterium GW2011_GWF2_41_45]KKS12333.1 MAG: Efflux transporter, RND family, MFP subunit [candidate division WWE3 bacterium GW2011_GWF1_41_53]KKS20407.1 MAG: Efflux transporter, RND family, MFP subunit [candidate division WWE3 bacterium GW2011_GWE1_41_72]KKS28295.1 MAG: Efflux transporter, RND family, MFP sub